MEFRRMTHTGLESEILMWSIVRITVQLLGDTVDCILFILGNEDDVHEKSIISVNGKVSCGSARKEIKDGEVRALQTLNVYSVDYGICLLQQFIGEKSDGSFVMEDMYYIYSIKSDGFRILC